MSLGFIVQTLVLAAAVALIALVAYMAVVLTDFRRTLASIDCLAKHMDEQLLPLAHRARRALDEVDKELTRIEGIVRSVESVSHRVGATAEVARHALSSPLLKIASWGAGMRKAVATLAHPEEFEEHGQEAEEI